MDRQRVFRYVGALVVTLALGQGIAIAQQPPAQTEPAPGGADVNAGLQRQVNLSPQEQLATADADMARMEQGRSVIRRALMEAREKRDVVKTLCLNDKLTQMNVAITSAQERRDALAGAVKRGDADLATHEFTILSVLRQRTDQLSAEANQCIGEEAGFVGQSSVEVSIEDLPEEDPSEYPDFGLLTEPPMCASCYN
jgi:hypothetical protein